MGQFFMVQILRTAVLWLALCAGASAEDYWALNLGSYHFDRSTPLNETNLGAGYGRKSVYCGGEAGAYWNSHDKLAVYGLGFCETPGDLSLGVFAGAATGYQDIPDHYHGVIPIAGLQIGAGPVLLRVNKEVAFLSWRFLIE